MAKQGFEASDGSEFEKFELKAAEVLVKGTSGDWGLLDILVDIFDSNRQSISEGDCKVRPGYAYDKFYLNRVSGGYDMSLFGLIHHIMYEDDLYSIFLNERQMEVVSQIVNEEPEGIYRTITDEESDEYEEDEFSNYTTGRIYTIAAKYTFKYLSEYGGSECNLSEFEDEDYDISGNEVDVDEVLGELSGPFSKVVELKKVWDDNKDRWEDGLDEDNFDFVKVVKKITEDGID